MRFTTFVYLTAAFNLTVATLTPHRQVRSTPQERDLNLQNFLITNIYSSSFKEPGISWNRDISFLFSDPNSNTSTICTHSWAHTKPTNNEPPFTYVACNPTGIDEVFQWFFTTYTNPKQFSIQFMHGFNDPENFPPPWEWVGMFSTENSFKLSCTESGGLQKCLLPPSQSPYRAVVNALTN